MELIKTNESVNRKFNGSQKSETINGVTYQIKENGNIVGNANVHNGGYSLTVNKSGSIEKLTAELESLFTSKTLQ